MWIKHAILLILWTLLTGTLFADDADILQVRSLANRGLFDAAEILCYEMFEQNDIAETKKVQLAAELARSYSLHLLHVEPAQRSRIIQKLKALERKIHPLVLHADATNNVKFQLQMAMTYYSIAETLYRESQFAEAASLYEQAAAQADASRQAEKLFLYNRLAAHSWMEALKKLSPDQPKIEYQTKIIALLRKLVVQNSKHHEASEFHSLALTMQGQVAASQPLAMDDYLTLLAEHIEHWPDSPNLSAARRQAVILLEQQGRLDEALAMLSFLDMEELSGMPPEIQRLRARKLDAEGKTQDAVDILIMLLKEKREPATLQFFAEILTRQSDGVSLNHALNFWRELESLSPRGGEAWRSAREGVIVVLTKLNRHEEAKQSEELLRILYPVKEQTCECTN